MADMSGGDYIEMGPQTYRKTPIMPQYDYHCENCENEFTLDLSMAEHERKERKREIRCPKCNSAAVKHIIRSIFVTTSKKS